MKTRELKPPRKFSTGVSGDLELTHCANIELAPDEQITFVSDSGTEFDVVRKSWGYYATPSVNRRLRKFGLRAGLCEGKGGALYVLLVEEGREADFQSYLEREGMRVVAWLDEWRDVALGE